jgi:hypothetical protein
MTEEEMTDCLLLYIAFCIGAWLYLRWRGLL